MARGIAALGVVLSLSSISAAGFDDQPEDWSSYIYAADGDVIFDDELAAFVAANLGEERPGALLFAFTQCHGGGMLDDLADRLEGRADVALFSASAHHESAWVATADTSAACLKACGLKEPRSYYVEALARALAEDRVSGLTLAELGELAARLDAAAAGGAATRPDLCSGEERVTEPEHPQMVFVGGGEALRLGRASSGEPLHAEELHAVLFVGEAAEVWARTDLERIHSELMACVFRPENMYVLAGNGPDPAGDPSGEVASPLAWPTFVDRPATREALFDVLGALLPTVGARGQLVFWSTGHGEHERRISWEHAVPLEGELPMTGSLGAEDPQLADDTRYELYAVAGEAGEEIGILLSSSDFDAFLYLYDSERQVIATDDDSGGGTDAYLRVVLPADGVYYVLANAFRPDGEGDYRLE
ncbi:MAG: PPC domain-containing protein, partial [Candidatus Bipolaricaulota bacterium]